MQKQIQKSDELNLCYYLYSFPVYSVYGCRYDFAGGYANMNPTVQTVGESSLSASDVSTIITPTNIMDAAQLAERNDY